MRIDANSDGSVEWDEFMNYLLLESQQLQSIRNEYCYYKNKSYNDPPGITAPGSHQNMISDFKILEDQGEGVKYISTARDGYVKIWNAKNL